MDHDAAQELFSDHLEGDLSPGQEEALREHLAGCESCRAELDALRETLHSLSALRRVAPPPEFLTQVQQRIRRRSRGRFFAPEKLLTRIPFEWISFVLIILMLALYMMTVVPQVKPVAPAPDAGARPIEQQPPPAPPVRDARVSG